MEKSQERLKEGVGKMLTDERLKTLEEFNTNYIIRREETQELIDSYRTLQQQNEQLDKSWSDGVDELYKQIEWRNKRIEKLEQQNKQLIEALERIQTDSTDAWAMGYSMRILQSLKGGTSNGTSNNNA
jgi:hypothetical protein